MVVFEDVLEASSGIYILQYRGLEIISTSILYGPYRKYTTVLYTPNPGD